MGIDPTFNLKPSEAQMKTKKIGYMTAMEYQVQLFHRQQRRDFSSFRESEPSTSRRSTDLSGSSPSHADAAAGENVDRTISSVEENILN